MNRVVEVGDVFEDPTGRRLQVRELQNGAFGNRAYCDTVLRDPGSPGGWVRCGRTRRVALWRLQQWSRVARGAR